MAYRPRRKQVEAALKESEERYRRLVELSPEAILVNSEGSIVFANPAAARLIGTENPQQLVGMPALAIVHSSFHEIVRERIRKMSEEGVAAPLIEEKYVRLDGKTIDVEVAATPITYQGKRAILVMVRDITERKRVEEERLRLANYMALLLESTDEGIYGIDQQATCLLINKSGAEMVGYAREELLGENVHQLFHHSHPDGSPYPVDECQVVRAIRIGQGVRVDNEVFWRRDGTSFPVEYSSYPIVERGEVVGAVITFADITERKRAERERLQLAQEQAARVERELLLAEVERRAAELDTTITSIVDGIIIYGPTEEIVRMNPAAERILGFTLEERKLPLGERMTLLQVETPDGRPFPVEEHPVYRAFQGESAQGVVMLIQRPHKTTWVSVSAAPIRASDGALLGVVANITDITALHELQEQREDILRAVSHDLRNPLTVVVGQTQLLLRALEKAGEKDALYRNAVAILTSARRMNTMIQDLVDSVRLEAGQLTLHKRSVDLRAFLDELLDRTKGVMDVGRIRVELPADLPHVAADPDRLERIFLNLLTNALKYSPPDSAVLVRAEPTEGEVLVSVTDQGIGIAPEDLPHIFERYYRTKGARKAEGIGLGLHITRMLVEAHGGRIWVESQLRKGSTFFLTLPRSYSSFPKPCDEDPHPDPLLLP